MGIWAFVWNFANCNQIENLASWSNRSINGTQNRLTRNKISGDFELSFFNTMHIYVWDSTSYVCVADNREFNSRSHLDMQCVTVQSWGWWCLHRWSCEQISKRAGTLCRLYQLEKLELRNSSLPVQCSRAEARPRWLPGVYGATRRTGAAVATAAAGTTWHGPTHGLCTG